MLTDTAEYALRAVLYLARQETGARVSAAQIADDLELPKNYLSKILRRLARRGVLESSRGPTGGFRLARSSEELTLGDTVEPFYDVRVDDRCLLGRRRCSDEEPCVAHHRWKLVVGDVRQFFRETTVGDLIRDERAPESGRTSTGDERTTERR